MTNEQVEALRQAAVATVVMAKRPGCVGILAVALDKAGGMTFTVHAITVEALETPGFAGAFGKVIVDSLKHVSEEGRKRGEGPPSRN